MDDKKEKTVSGEENEKKVLTEEELKNVTAGGTEGSADIPQSPCAVYPGISGFP